MNESIINPFVFRYPAIIQYKFKGMNPTVLSCQPEGVSLDTPVVNSEELILQELQSCFSLCEPLAQEALHIACHDVPCSVKLKDFKAI